MNKILTLLVLSIAATGANADIYEQMKKDPTKGAVIAVTVPAAADIPAAELVVPQQQAKPAQKLRVGGAAGKTAADLTQQKLLVGAKVPQSGPVTQISADEVRREVRQPERSITVPQDALIGTAFEYLRVIKPSERLYVNKDNGLVYFRLEKGSLKANIEALLAGTNSEAPVMAGISDNHTVPSAIWLHGDSVLDVLDATLISYEEPFPIYAEPFANRIVEVKYDTKQ